jgi:hypothetical protein
MNLCWGHCSQSAHNRSLVMADDKQVGLDLFTKKSLLNKIEGSHVSRANLNLKEICAADPFTFGSVGTPLRRAIQLFWNNIKRESIQSYARRLQISGIALGDGTRRELEDQTGRPLSNESESLALSDASSGTTTAATPDDAAAAESTAEIAAAAGDDATATVVILDPLQKVMDKIEDLVVSFHSPSNAAPPTSAQQNPPTSAQRNPPTSAQRNLNYETMESSEDVSSSSTTSYPEGSRYNPVVILVPNKPEDSLFEVLPLDRIVHGDWSRKGYCIRKEIGVPDGDCWSASMYSEPPYHTCKRAVLIHGLKRSSVYEEYKAFNRRDDHCPALKEIMCNTTTALQADPERRNGYWLLVFPNDVELDNVILSGDPVEIMKKTLGQMTTYDGIASASLFVYWFIACKSGGHRLSEKAEASAKSAFA